MAILPMVFLATGFGHPPITNAEAREAIYDCKRSGGEPDVIYSGKYDGGSVRSVYCYTDSGRSEVYAERPGQIVDSRKEEVRRRCSLTGNIFVDAPGGSYRCEFKQPPERFNRRIY